MLLKSYCRTRARFAKLLLLRGVTMSFGKNLSFCKHLAADLKKKTVLYLVCTPSFTVVIALLNRMA